MNDFKVLLQAVLDSSGIGKSDIAEVQKVLEKYHINLTADLNKAELVKTVKQIVPDLEKELKKITGVNIKINDTDLIKAINQVEKNSIQAAKSEEKLVDTMERVRAKSEDAAKAEEKRRQLAQNQAVNKALEQEYNSKEKLAAQMADYRQKSELATKAEEKRTNLAQNNAINSALEKEYLAVEKINQAISSGTNEAKVEKLTASFRGLGFSTEDTLQKLSGVNGALNSLNGSSDNKSLINNAKLLESEYKKVENQIKQLTATQKGFATESQRLSSASGMKSWIDNNSKASKLFKADIDQMIDSLRSADNLTLPELNKINAEFEKIKYNAREMGLLGKTAGNSFKDMGSKFVSWVTVSGGIMTAITGLKKMKDAVIEIDTAMTNLYKVTDETDAKYSSFLSKSSKSAQELGRSVSSLVEQSANWAKLGFSIDESADLAKISSIYANVGEVSDETAVSDLVTAMKALNIESSKSIGIVDELNNLSNNYAVSAAGLGEGLKNSASALALQGNSLEQILALLTGGGEIKIVSISSNRYACTLNKCA